MAEDLHIEKTGMDSGKPDGWTISEVHLKPIGKSVLNK
jgi:hypothetical protein